MGTHLPDADQTRLLHQGDVDIEPARSLTRRLWIEVRALAVELGYIRMGRFGHPYDAGNSGFCATGVVKERAVAEFHAVAHEITRLIIAHAPPGGGLPRRGREVIDAEYLRLGFHQPVIHHPANKKMEPGRAGTLTGGGACVKTKKSGIAAHFR